MSDPEIATVHQPGAGGVPPTSNVNPVATEPVKIITEDNHLDYPRIENMLRKKGHGEQRIADIVHELQVIYSFHKTNGIELDEDGWMDKIIGLEILP